MARITDCRKLIGRVGRPYYSQACTLIQICRDITSEMQDIDKNGFSGIIEDAYDTLVEAVDDTISGIEKAKASKEIFNKSFDNALAFCQGNPQLHRRIKLKINESSTKDKDSSSKFKLLTQRISSKIKSSLTSKAIELQVCDDLLPWRPDVHAIPITIQPDISLESLLFILVFGGHIKLKDNPHFYRELPSLKERNIRWDSPKYEPMRKLVYSDVQSMDVQILFILKDRWDQVSLECRYSEFSHTFRNVWQYHETFVFKESAGSFKTLESICDDHSTRCSESESIGCSRYWNKLLSESFAKTPAGFNATRSTYLACPAGTSFGSHHVNRSMLSFETDTTAVLKETDTDISSGQLTMMDDGDSALSSSATVANTRQHDSTSDTASPISVGKKDTNSSDSVTDRDDLSTEKMSSPTTTSRNALTAPPSAARADEATLHPTSTWKDGTFHGPSAEARQSEPPAPIGATSVLPEGKAPPDADHSYGAAREKADMPYKETSRAPSPLNIDHIAPGVTPQEPVPQEGVSQVAAGNAVQTQMDSGKPAPRARRWYDPVVALFMGKES